MKVALIARSTLYDVPGGDTVQITETARRLQQAGIEAVVCLTHQPVSYSEYDLFHFFNITRPADILYHIRRIKKPFLVSPVFADYSEYDKHHRAGVSGLFMKFLSPGVIEYAKTISRWLKGGDTLKSKRYILKGHNRSIREILKQTAVLLPNSVAEYTALEKKFGIKKEYTIVPNGVDASVFKDKGNEPRDQRLVLCVARIEGIKNQLNLIRALNNTPYHLMIIGSPAPNQGHYFKKCKQAAADNVTFTGQLSQSEVAAYYAKAKVHALPSWFETCGLSSLEAAAMGCNIVITDKGYTRDYFGDDAFYCDPGDPASIRNAVEKAAIASHSRQLQERVLNNFTWEKAAALTLDAYKKVTAG